MKPSKFSRNLARFKSLKFKVQIFLSTSKRLLGDALTGIVFMYFYLFSTLVSSRGALAILNRIIYTAFRFYLYCIGQSPIATKVHPFEHFFKSRTMVLPMISLYICVVVTFRCPNNFWTVVILAPLYINKVAFV